MFSRFAWGPTEYDLLFAHFFLISSALGQDMVNLDFIPWFQVQFCIMGNLLRILLSPDPPSKGADIFVDFESKNVLYACICCFFVLFLLLLSLLLDSD